MFIGRGGGMKYNSRHGTRSLKYHHSRYLWDIFLRPQNIFEHQKCVMMMLMMMMVVVLPLPSPSPSPRFLLLVSFVIISV
jgi:hypothetical protein